MPKVPSLVVVGLLVCLPAGVLAGCAKDEAVTSPGTTARAAATTPSSSGTTPGTRATGTTGTAVPATARPGTTATSTITPPSTAPTTRPPTSAPPGSGTPAPPPTTPDGFAKALVDAWKAGDQTAAAQVAEAPAVAKLFASPDQDPTSYVFLDCGGAAGSTICRFNSGSETLLVYVRNTTGGLPMMVTDVRITGAGG